MCKVDSDGEEGIFGLREVGDISNEEAAAAFLSDEEEGDKEEEGPEEAGVSTCWPLPATSAPGPPTCGAEWAAGRSM